MRIATVAGAILTSVVAATWAVELQYTFDQVAGSTVTNEGTWGASFDGTLTVKGTVGAVGTLPDITQWGKAPGGQYLVGLSGSVLHSVTTIGTRQLTFDPNPPGPTQPNPFPPADGVGFFTPQGVSPGNHTEQNCSISFWLKGGAGINTGNSFVGIGGGQLFPSATEFAYNNATGDKAFNNWWIGPTAPTYSAAVNPFTDLGNWHFYTVSLTNGWGQGQTFIYRDGVLTAAGEGNPFWSAYTVGLGDGLGLRIGGREFGGQDVYIDNLMWKVGTTNAAGALALFNEQFAPEPGVAMLLLAGLSALTLRRCRR